MVIVGAGGHAREILSVIEEQEVTNRIIFFDNISGERKFYNYDVLTRIEDVLLEFERDNSYALAIGGQKSKRDINSLFLNLKGKPLSIISRTAFVGPHNTILGVGLNIMREVFISNSVSIGNYTLLNHRSSVHHDVTVGQFCEISPSVQLLGGCKIGDFCFVGAGSIILPNVVVGNNVTIGAGSVVNKNVGDDVVVYGVPARTMKRKSI